MIYRFQLRANGTKKLYNDVQRIVTKNPLLDLWHKQHKLENRVSTYVEEKIRGYGISEKAYISILNILGDHKSRTNYQLRNHPKLRSLVVGKDRKWIEIRTRSLHKLGLIIEARSMKYRKS